MSSALMVQQDAITGFWDVDQVNLQTPGNSGVSDDLKYLSDFRRQQILMGELCANFGVEKRGRRSVYLKLRDTDICKIKKPTYARGNGLRPQMALVRGYSDLRSDRIPEIYRQMDDIISFYEAAVHMNLNRREATLHVLSAVHSAAITLEMQVKHYAWMPRPSEYAQQVQPIIPTPDHSSYPSGHATEAFAVATVLHRLTTGQTLSNAMQEPSPPMVFRIAHRIALNRTVAGVHFPVDSAAGAVLGGVLGEAIGDLAETASGAALTPKTLDFAPTRGRRSVFKPDQDFDLPWIALRLRPVAGGHRVRDHHAPLFSELWDAAKDEWS